MRLSRSDHKYRVARFHYQEMHLWSSRRDFNSDTFKMLISSSLPFILQKSAPSAYATEIDDAYNNLKNDPIISTTAQSRSVILNFEGDGRQVFVDGSSFSKSSIVSPSIQTVYQVPTKWSDPPEYLDTFSSGSNPLKACERIIVYQAPLGDDPMVLEKATSIGVAKALGWMVKGGIVEKGLVPPLVERADVISGRKLYKSMEESTVDSTVSEKSEQRQYFEFDIAVAPSSCSESEQENLRLGFCPYESIILISATIVKNNLFVICVLCTKDEWKRANSDIKRVRTSFKVNEL